MRRRGPIRVLHVLGALNPGGVETWLLHVLRHVDRNRFDIDFLVHTEKEAVYDGEVRALGSAVLPCLSPFNPLKYARNFRRLLSEHGPYDVVHSHVHHFSGYVLALAKKAGIPVRIAHSHSDTAHAEADVSLMRKGYLSLMQCMVSANATDGLAVSAPAAAALFGPRWERDDRWRVHYCGIDLTPYGKREAPGKSRRSLGIPEDAPVLGHVGRFAEMKNHKFFVEVASRLAQLNPTWFFLLVGDGPLRARVEQQVTEMGLGGRFIFTGVRRDVHSLLGTMDAFLFPSLYEGLPLVLIEAQAAGVKCYVSDQVTAEVNVVTPMTAWMSLTDGAAAWAMRIEQDVQAPTPTSPEECLSIISKSSFNISNELDELLGFYVGLGGRK